MVYNRQLSRGWLVQWKNTRFVFFCFQQTVVRYLPYKISFQALYTLMFDARFNISDKIQSRNLDSKKMLRSLICMKGERSPDKIGPMTHALSLWMQ